MVSNCSWISEVSLKWGPHSFDFTHNTSRQIRQVRRVGEHSHTFSSQKLLHWKSTEHIVMFNQPVLVLPSFCTSSADLRLQTLQNVLIVMPVNRLASRKKNSQWKIPSKSKKNCHHLLDVWLDFKQGQGRLNPLRGLLFGFWIVT